MNHEPQTLISVPERIAGWAKRTPDALAVSSAAGELSFAELDRRAEAVAIRLAECGIGRESIVALCLPRSPELVVAALGTLKAGAAYLPIDPSNPIERQRGMVHSSGARAVVAHHLEGLDGADGVRTMSIDELLREGSVDLVPSRCEIDPDQLAYVIFTSGSSGAPKGTALHHRGLSNLLAWDHDWFERTPADRCALEIGPGFDASVWETWSALVAGCSLHIPDPQIATSPAGLLEWWRRERITIASLPTPLAEAVLLEGIPDDLSLRILGVGGDRLKRRPPRNARFRLSNLYGPTEVTITATASWVAPAPTLGASKAGGDDPDIGRVIPGLSASILVVGLDGEPRTVTAGDLHPGIEGELCLGGAGVARGYLGRPDLTAERFVPDPNAPFGARLYRTGDRVRVRPDGAFEILGRIDEQIKLRGHRIEPGEIEGALTCHPAVAAAAVLVRPGEGWLSAYVVRRDPAVDPRELRDFLSATLPAVMVPSAWVFLAELPLTANGKIDRRALAALDPSEAHAFDRGVGAVGAEGEDGAVPRDRTPLEQLFADLFAEVLDLGREVHVDEDFFEMGGHSLAAARLASRARTVLGRDIGVHAVFEQPTVARLAAAVSLSLGGFEGRDPWPRSSAENPSDPLSLLDEANSAAPLSYAQRRVWLAEALDPGTAVYNVARTLDLHGRLVPTALAAALVAIERRQSSLATHFVQFEGSAEPRQVVGGAPAITLPRIDLTALTPLVRDHESARIAHAFATAPFALATGPIWRALLFELGPERHRLALAIHHIAADGWSFALLLNELAELYRWAAESVAAGNRPSNEPPRLVDLPRLAELPVSVADFARWQRSEAAAAASEAGLAWWRTRLSGIPETLDLPFERPRLAARSAGAGGVVRRAFRTDVVAALGRFGRPRATTPFMTLLTAVAALLSRFADRDDLVIATPAANRSRRELEGLIGFFVNLLPLRLDLGADPSFAELTGRVRESVLSAFGHAEVQFERIVEAIGREGARAPFPNVVFADEPSPTPPRLWGGVAVELGEIDTETAKFDLTLTVRRSSSQATAALEYAADRFDRASAERLLSAFVVLLEGALDDPSRPLAELPLLAEAEIDAVVRLGQRTSLGPISADDLPLARFRRTVAAAPDALAIVESDGDGNSDADGRQVSYRELAARVAERAGRIAAVLGASGSRNGAPRTETVVAIVLPRSIELVVSMLAALEAGSAWLPIDPEHPAERIAATIADAHVGAVVATAAMFDRLSAISVPSALHVVVDARETLVAEPPGFAPRLAPALADAEALAYVIYTSGSTGTPKGTELTQGGLANLIAWHLATYPLTPNDRCSVIAGPGFDASVWELWPTLAAGAALVIPPAERLLAGEELARWLARERITVSFLPTPLAETLLAWLDEVGVVGAPPLPALRALLVGGDRLRRRTPAGFSFGLINHYGPTEATVVSTAGDVLPSETVTTAPSIGRAIAGTSAHVLDRALAPLPPDVVGELFVGGASLARGYRDRAALTAERFVPNPFAERLDDAGSRLYRTGDRVRRLANGEIQFLGRTDSQVKIRGQRIELGEVEAALAAEPEVAEVVVLADRDPRGEPRLAAYLVAARGVDEPLGALLAARLSRRLPAAMIPSAWKVLDAFALTPNGKVDRRALAALEPHPLALSEQAGDFRDAASGADDPILELVARTIADLLELESVPRAHDDFFRLGGHSLLAVELANRLRRGFGVALEPRAVFEHPTPYELARRIERGGGDPRPPLVPRARPSEDAAAADEAPLAFGQERLWFLDRLTPGTATYNLPVRYEIGGSDLSVARLAAALGEIERRHEVLRSVLIEGHDGHGVQRVQPIQPAQRRLPVVDFARFTATAEGRARAGREAARIAEREAQRPFDLARGPLWRTLLLSGLSADREPSVPRADLLVSMHHAVSDGSSLGIFASEVAELYRSVSGASPSSSSPSSSSLTSSFRTSSRLAPLPIQFGDFASWQRRWLVGETLEAEVARGVERLRGLPDGLELPADRPRPPVLRAAGEVVTVPFASMGDAELGRLADLGRRFGATPFMVLLTAFAAWVERVSGAGDFALGVPADQRDRAELSGLIGFFVNTLAVRIQGSPNEPFEALAERVRASTVDAFLHRDLPFEHLVAELAPRRDLSRSPIFQVLMSYEAAPPAAIELGRGLVARPFEIPTATAKFDLSAHFTRTAHGLELRLEAAADLFDRATVVRFGEQLETLLVGAMATPERPIAELPLLSARERAEIVAWNLATRATPAGGGWDLVEDQRLFAPFTRQAALTPTAWAVAAHGVSLTYAELEERSAQIAASLRALGVGADLGTECAAEFAAEFAVGVCLPRTVDLVASMLGILRAGGFYVPLDPSYPSERLGFQIEDSGCSIVITEPSVEAVLPRELRRVTVDQLIATAKLGEGEPRATLSSAVLPESLAYLIYTSGSTGRPKAVAITHRNAAVMVHWALVAFSDAEMAGLVAPTSIAFDLSVFEIFVPLSRGGAVLLVDNALAPSLASLEALPPGLAPTMLNTVPSAAAELVASGDLPRGATTIALAGEALSRSLSDRLYARPETARVLNLYGPSEDTTYSTWAVIERTSERAPSIGRPIAGSAAYVVDANDQFVPLGVPGELHLAGLGLARGYLGRPELTAERFIPDPFAATPGARRYRTGDLVRWRADGSLDYLGRIDHQIKLRGFRIELGEIESALGDQDGVAESVVVARGLGGDGSAVHLVAFVGSPGVEALDEGALDARAAALKQALRQRLPEVMIPSVFAFRDALPRTPNGKVDRKALPQGVSEHAGARSRSMGEGPRTELEARLVDVWREVLDLSAETFIGRDDGFFDLGGHSLLAMRLLARLRSRFGVSLSLSELFAAPTIAGLAARWENTGAREEPESAVVADQDPNPGRGGRQRAPLTAAMRRLWFLERLHPGLAVYNLPLAFAVEGVLDLAAFDAALGALVRRHSVLGSAFVIDPTTGEVMQEVGRERSRNGRTPLVDLSALAPERRGREARRVEGVEAQRPFDLASGKPMRALVVRETATELGLVLTLHHIVTDGWSNQILLSELAAIYCTLLDYTSATPPAVSPLPPLPLQVVDLGAWEAERGPGAEESADLEFWRERLAEPPPPLDLPLDRARGEVQSFRGASSSRPLPAPVGAALARLAETENATLFQAALAGFFALLARISGQDDLVVGTPAAARPTAAMEKLIGFFVDTVVVRQAVQTLNGSTSFRSLLRATRARVLEALEHRAVPFERLVEEIAPGRNLNRTPIFQAMFVVEREQAPRIELSHEGGAKVALVRRRIDTATAKFDLSFGISIASDGSLTAEVEYPTALFDAATGERFVSLYAALLSAALDEPDRPSSELPLLSESERQMVTVRWNQTDVDSPRDATLWALFLRQVAATPDAIAVVDDTSSRSYRELSERAARLAVRLMDLGIGRDQTVGFLVDRSVGMIEVILGIVAAGGAYVPLDSTAPASRLAALIAQVGARAVIVEERLASRLVDIELPKLSLAQAFAPHPRGVGRSEPASQPLSNLWRLRGAAGDGSQLAYVVFTSGSTGEPKGVAATHRGVTRLVLGADYGTFGPHARFLQLAPVAFDASTFEIWGALLSGGTLAVPPPGPQSLDQLAELLVRHRVNFLFLTTGLFHQMAESRIDALSSLEQLLAGGDVLAPALVRKVVERFPNLAMSNIYGPTEGTTYTTARRFVDVNEIGERVSIGGPNANSRVYLLDRAMSPVPVGVVGRLYVAGDGLARGYVGRGDLTAERFVPDPVSGEFGARLYDTGDLARWHVDGADGSRGALEFLGRADLQLKIRGFRIEPAEVEAALRAVPGIRSALVTAVERAGDKRLGAFLVADETCGGAESRPTVAVLREALRQRLPESMVPSIFVFVSEFPLSSTGKVDRRALAQLAATWESEGGDEHGEGGAALREKTPPRTMLEEQVAAIWSEVLGVGSIHVEDDFFDLGGHSLLATKVLVRVREAFDVELPLETLFLKPSLGDWSEAVGHAVLAEAMDQDQDLERLMAELDGLSENEVRALLDAEMEEAV